MARPIRLTYVITDLEVGGVPLHLHRLATRLAGERFDVRVISLADEGPVGRMLQRDGVPVDACRARGAWDVAALFRLRRHLRLRRPDILHALLFHANVAVRLVGPSVGMPIHRILCEIQTVEQERPWHLVVDNLTCRLCRLEIGNSPSVVGHLAARAHIPASRLRCEPGGIDVERFARAGPISRESLGVPPDVPLLIWTGRLDPVKGLDTLLKAMTLPPMPPQARLVLVGEGDYRPSIERLIAESGLTGRVVMLGERGDVPELLKAADLYVFPSRTEGYPNALLEAMAAGLPVVATAVAGCRDIVVDGQTGVLVPYGSAEALSGAVAGLISDVSRAVRMARSGQEWVRRHADIAVVAERWQRFYEDLLRRGKTALDPV